MTIYYRILNDFKELPILVDIVDFRKAQKEFMDYVFNNDKIEFGIFNRLNNFDSKHGLIKLECNSFLLLSQNKNYSFSIDSKMNFKFNELNNNKMYLNYHINYFSKQHNQIIIFGDHYIQTIYIYNLNCAIIEIIIVLLVEKKKCSNRRLYSWMLYVAKASVEVVLT